MNWPRLVSPVVVQAYLDLYELLCCLNFEPELLGLLYPPDLYTSSALSCDHTTKLGLTINYCETLCTKLRECFVVQTGHAPNTPLPRLVT